MQASVDVLDNCTHFEDPLRRLSMKPRPSLPDPSPISEGIRWTESRSVLSVDIQASTFENQVGNPTETRTITSLTDHEFKFTRHGQLPNTKLEVVFKRAP